MNEWNPCKPEMMHQCQAPPVHRASNGPSSPSVLRHPRQVACRHEKNPSRPLFLSVHPTPRSIRRQKTQRFKGARDPCDFVQHGATRNIVSTSGVSARACRALQTRRSTKPLALLLSVVELFHSASSGAIASSGRGQWRVPCCVTPQYPATRRVENWVSSSEHFRDLLTSQHSILQISRARSFRVTILSTWQHKQGGKLQNPATDFVEPTQRIERRLIGNYPVFFWGYFHFEGGQNHKIKDIRPSIGLPSWFCRPTKPT